MDDTDEPNEADDASDDAGGGDPFEREAGVDYGEASHLDEIGQPRLVRRELTVHADMAGLRLDHFLKKQIPRLSRTKLQAIIASQLTRPGRPIKASSQVQAGEVLLLTRPAAAEPPCPRTFTVLHHDERVLVVDKPAGLPVHPTAKFYFNTLTRVVAERFGTLRWQLCHRLDRETSGALALAGDKVGAAVIKQAFEHKRVQKEYLAIVRGVPPWSTRTSLSLPMRLSTPRDATLLPSVRMIVGDGAPARTDVLVEHVIGQHAIVRCFPATGRQHQIRAHLAHAGFPIVGDKLYGATDQAFMAYCDRGFTPELRELFVHPRHALHAASVEFPHPDGGRLRLESPLPTDLLRLAARLAVMIL